MNRQEATLYLSLVHCWDNQHAMNFKCVSAIIPNWHNANLPPIVTNTAVQSLEEMLDVIELRGRTSNLGVYAATAAFKMASIETYKDGYRKAIRKRENVATLNALYTDIDVKPKAYESTELALVALGHFCKASGMPEPTIVVKSGSGGIHPYWCTAEPMSLATWQPLADALKEAIKQHGLITDAGVTADAARILRVPGTFNYKSGKPVPVELIVPERIVQYTVSGLAQVLQPYNVAQTRTGSGTTQAQPSAWAQSFGAGVADQAMPKLSIDDIAVNCPMTAVTLMDGGVGKSEPEWSQDMFLAAFTLDPVDAAHRLSRGHLGYSVPATDKKLAEKQAAIAANPKLGWPACASFTHAACQTCPLLKFGKSPITFAHQLKPQAQPVQPGYQVDDLMPEGEEFWRNANDHVFGNGPSGFPIDVLGYPILDGGIDQAAGGALVLKTRIGGKERWGSCLVAKHTGVGVCEALAKGTDYGIMVRADHQKIAMRFIMAWMTHLQEKRKFHTAAGFGWDGDSFVFGDQLYTPAGPVAAYRGETDDVKYRAKGKLDPWRDAMKLVYGNVPLETIVASAFAAPLVTLTCDHSVVMAVYSDLSGFGKSTAMKLAQAVWGDPRTGMSTLQDTENSVNKKATSLKNLPIYWDELKLEEQKDKMVSVIFSVTQGQTKARLNRDATQQKVGAATTMLVLATNRGIAEHVERKTEGTDAGSVRVFEYEIDQFKSTLSSADAGDLMRKISDNYGVAGTVYADFLVRNKDTAEKVVRAVREQIAAGCKIEAKDRFWEIVMVTLISGAYLANTCGLTTFDVPAMQAHLIDSLRKLRTTSLTKSTYDYNSLDYGELALNEMMMDIRGRHLIVTDIVPSGMGPAQTATVVQEYSNRDTIWMQKGRDDERIVVSIRAFNAWLASHNHQVRRVRELLERDFIIRERKVVIGAGTTQFKGMGRTNCYDMTPRQKPDAEGQS